MADEQALRRARLGWFGLLLAIVLVVLLAVGLRLGEEPGAMGRHIRTAADAGVARLGPIGAFVGLYAEESGLPLPLPGDFLVIYLGRQFASWPLGLVAAWLGLELAVVGGATNLYLLSRHFGRRLLHGWVGALMHLTPGRLARAERWYRRWGPLAIICGRHILGLRPVVTVASGMLRIRYPVFALSTAISTAPWAAFWLWIGVRYGRPLEAFLRLHGSAYVVVPLLVIGLVMAGALRRRARTADLDETEKVVERGHQAPGDL